MDVHERYLELLKSDMPSANLSYTIQPVAESAVAAGQDRGGNSLGLELVSQACKCSPISAPINHKFHDVASKCL